MAPDVNEHERWNMQRGVPRPLIAQVRIKKMTCCKPFLWSLATSLPSFKNGAHLDLRHAANDNDIQYRPSSFVQDLKTHQMVHCSYVSEPPLASFGTYLMNPADRLWHGSTKILPDGFPSSFDARYTRDLVLALMYSTKNWMPGYLYEYAMKPGLIGIPRILAACNKTWVELLKEASVPRREGAYAVPAIPRENRWTVDDKIAQGCHLRINGLYRQDGQEDQLVMCTIPSLGIGAQNYLDLVARYSVEETGMFNWKIKQVFIPREPALPLEAK